MVSCKRKEKIVAIMKNILILIFITLFMLLNMLPTHAAKQGKVKIKIKVSSTAFKNGGFLPVQYTCDGNNISPPLNFSSIPEDTQSLALILEDPDAPGGTFTHWIIYNLPGNTTNLTENIPTDDTLENGAEQGVNDFGQIGYGSPCPPPGLPHRYIFKLYALNVKLDLSLGATKKQLLGVMKGHILQEGKLIGHYKR